MALVFIVLQAHYIMNNIFEGLIWFFLPASLVITNDIFAYICGITFGRTPLIKLSPKKTVEGFVGAWICTVILGVFMTNLLMRYNYFVCPVNDLGANILTGLRCTPNPVFIARPYQLPDWTHVQRLFWIAPMQFHIMVFATFASLIAPFGGFFASGLKRTFKVKDFGDSIPGHGGMTDRMDCQFIMGLFAYMYYQSFIAVYHSTVGGVIESAIVGLSVEEQIEVVKGLSKYLYNQGVFSEQVRPSCLFRSDITDKLRSFRATQKCQGDEMKNNLMISIPSQRICHDYISMVGGARCNWCYLGQKSIICTATALGSYGGGSGIISCPTWLLVLALSICDFETLPHCIFRISTTIVGAGNRLLLLAALVPRVVLSTKTKLAFGLPISLVVSYQDIEACYPVSAKTSYPPPLPRPPPRPPL